MTRQRAPLFPVSPAAGEKKPGGRNRRRDECSSGRRCICAAVRCYHSRMLDQLDALTSRMQDLVAHVRQLRDENHQLRTQLATSQTELAALNERIATATQRLDALIERLPRELREPDAG